jgi:SsrA-binding protein
MSGDAYLVNARIEPYPGARQDGYDPTRSRRLLLHRSELIKLQQRQDTERLTLVPLELGLVKNLIKLHFAVGKGKRAFEKRRTLREQDLKRETDRAMKLKR